MTGRLYSVAAVGLLGAGVLGGVGWGAYMFDGRSTAQNERAGAQGQAKDFATQLAELCRDNPTVARQQGVSCAEASAVASKPVEAITGPAGPSGPPGPGGPSGPPGASGRPGSVGSPGRPGSNGTPGANGTSGTSGTEPPAGHDGTNGTSGTSGTSGTEGPMGQQGSPGQPAPQVVGITCTGGPATFWFDYSDGSQRSATCSPPPPTLTPGDPTPTDGAPR